MLLTTCIFFQGSFRGISAPRWLKGCSLAVYRCYTAQFRPKVIWFTTSGEKELRNLNLEGQRDVFVLVGQVGCFALYVCGYWILWWVRLVFLNYFVVLLLLNLFWYSIKCWCHAWCSLADANVCPILFFDRYTAIPMSANEITCDELSWYQDFSRLRPLWSCGCICFSHVNDRQFRNGSWISAPEVSDIASVLLCGAELEWCFLDSIWNYFDQNYFLKNNVGSWIVF